MNVHVLQHVPFEGLGSIASWLKAQQAVISYTRFFISAELPAIDEIDCLIVLGGPMSVHDRDIHPWLDAETAFIAQAIQAEKVVLGICLGAQLIAHSQGAAVFKNPQKEIGWFPITGIAHQAEAFHFPAATTVFHWHGETFDLPQQAIHLAQSSACRHQAFQLGRHVIGLQFHLETTAESAAEIIQHCGDELIEQPFIQSRSALLATADDHYQTVNRLMAEILHYLLPDQ